MTPQNFYEMKVTTPLFVTAIVLTAIGSFFLGRNLPAQQISKNTKEKVSIASASINQPGTPAATPSTDEVAAKDSSKLDETVNQDESISPLEVREADDLPSNPIANKGIHLPRIQTGISDNKIGSILSSIAENLEKKKLPYVSSLSQDCSGIFHQLKDSIQKRLPALRKGSSYQYPEYKNIRSSRQIADWYYTNKNLLIVEDPIASRNSIRPGSVMFYGKPNKKYKNMTIESLTDKNNNYTSNGAIMHIAVVTSVRTDDEGNVLEYTIMHGRNKRVHASRSGSKEVQSKRTKGLPPFGNWSQQWVAVANIMTEN